MQVGEQITDVLQASFAHMPREDRGRALLHAATILALIMAPLGVGLGAVKGRVFPSTPFFRPKKRKPFQGVPVMCFAMAESVLIEQGAMTMPACLNEPEEMQAPTSLMSCT